MPKTSIKVPVDLRDRSWRNLLLHVIFSLMYGVIECGIRTLASLLGLLLVRSYERSLRVREAMLLRGFTGHFRSVSSFRARVCDYFFALGLLLCMAGIIAVECLGGFNV